jgi:hypothetical protein
MQTPDGNKARSWYLPAMVEQVFVAKEMRRNT